MGKIIIPKLHKLQKAYAKSTKRFNLVRAPRRSGKTYTAVKYRLTPRAFGNTSRPDARYAACAPTRDQAKRIFWDELLKWSPPELVKDISRGELVITYWNGARIYVVGMDKPERIEGSSWDGIACTEMGNIKPEAFQAHIRPALIDRQGWFDGEGVPEGRKPPFYDMFVEAEKPENAKFWDTHYWTYMDAVSCYLGKAKALEEYNQAKSEMDILLFRQEYDGDFISFEGQAYHAFDRPKHCARSLEWDGDADLDFAFDFNVSPGVCSVSQEVKNETHCIGEVWIPKNSNTGAVCRKLIEDWGDHDGDIVCYGDATGGARGSAKVAGSDWDIIEEMLGDHFGADRVILNVKKQNPSERARVNALNSRLKTGDGKIHMCFDPEYAKRSAWCVENTSLLAGGSGELDKPKGSLLAHMSDGIGYKIDYLYPKGGGADTFAMAI